MSIRLAILPALFWLAGAVRLPAARRSVAQRALCAALFCFAGSLTVYLAPLYVGLDRVLGIANFSDLAEDVLPVLGAAFLIDVSLEITSPERKKRARLRTYALAGAAVAISAVLFVLAPAEPETVRFGQAYGGVPQVAAYSMVDIAYLDLCLLEFTRLWWRHCQHVSRRSMRLGLRLVAAGAVGGFLWSLVLFVGLTAALVAPQSHVVSDTAPFGRAMLAIFGMTAGLGLLLPAAAKVVTRVRRRVAAVAALCRLRPVWLCAIDAAPHVVLGERPSRVTDVLAARPDLRLLGRMVEIRDAMLALRMYVADDEAVAAQAAAHRYAPGPQRAATEFAWYLRSAIDAMRAGVVPLALPPTVTPAHDVEDEYAFAKALAAEWATPRRSAVEQLAVQRL